MMKTLARLWIDHRETVIVILSDKGQETRRVKSHVEKQARRFFLPDQPMHLEGYQDVLAIITYSLVFEQIG